MLLVLGIALALSLLIVSSFIESSTAQSDDDSGWWDARDYYNQFANFKDSDNYDFLFLILFFIIIIGIIIWKITHRTKERRYFSAEVKRQILKNQNYKCAICKRNTEVWDYDHKNGDRSNNKITNCQALCPNCHAKKTRSLLKNKAKSSRRLLKLFIISLIIVVVIYFFYWWQDFSYSYSLPLFGQYLEINKSISTYMKYRSRTEIVPMILDSANGGATKTKMMYKAFLSYNQLKECLTILIENNLIEYLDGTRTFRTREKGLNFLKMHNEIAELFTTTSLKW